MEEAIRGVQEAIADTLDEMQRTRSRLHSLEATAQGLELMNKQRETERRKRDLSLARWIQILTLVVALTGVIGPLIYSGATR